MNSSKLNTSNYNNLLLEISNILTDAKSSVARTVNKTIVVTNWHIGKYIVEYEFKGKDRAEYGTQLLKRLSNDLTNKFGRGYSWRNLYNMKEFYKKFQILQTSSAKFNNKISASFSKLTWSHYVRLLSINDEDERNFYLIEAAENNWKERELDRQINSSLFERLVLSKNKEKIKELSENGHIMQSEQDILKDPLILEFLNIKNKDDYSENDLEAAIINNIGEFLLELGKGFTFVARQQKISSGTEHFFIDLVFYNRLLRSFVIIDLKIGKLKHQDIGQMQMYVNYYDREVKTDNENPTIGIILCKENDEFVVEYTLPENNKQIFANEYKLYLPNKKELRTLLEKYI
ncbi:MAG: PDDEXK nuclease domain-containing protein [Bacteroidales bacterium]|jgi:predicted nuclease of restriction endonuclease-like (RecB) superfamily|nr:PDDEXK nuclease domain-containing protein [Bacteroidales bacterium]